jgi:Fanconi anemia group M protein
MYVDDREPSSIIEALRRRIPIIVARLDIADYAVGSRIGVERKTASDLVNAVFTGQRGEKPRLWSQLENLVNSYEIPVLLIEGEPRSVLRGRTAEDRIFLGVEISLLKWHRLKIIRTFSEFETVDVLEFIANLEGESGKPPPVVEKHLEPIEIKKAMLCCIKGIGLSTAEKILNKYPQFSQIASASIEELSKLVGEKRACLLKEILG